MTTQQEFLDRLSRTFADCLALCRAKNADYGGGEDPFFNMRACEALHVCDAETAVLARMLDKMVRVSQFVKRGDLAVKSESIDDTLHDLIVYAGILKELIGERGAAKPDDAAPPVMDSASDPAPDV